jgi:hypothetical protein
VEAHGYLGIFTALPSDNAPTDNKLMEWHVQYRKDGAEHITMHPSPETAIEAACRLIDDGNDVYGIGTGPLTDYIGKDVIAKIYALWDATPHLS